MTLPSTVNKPNIFEYEDYRSFLRATYLFHKTRFRHFSFRYFSKRAGFSSPNFLKLVIEGKRNLSPDSVQRFVSALKLSNPEGEFFGHLVDFSQARNPSERAACSRKIIQCKGFQKVHPLKQAEYSYYANWYYIPVREIAALPDFIEDPAWIARKIFPEIKIEQAAQALRDLEALGLLRRTTEGRIAQAQKTVTTENEVVSSSVAHYHKEMMQRAADSIDTVPRSYREISAACIPVSRPTAEKIKKMVQDFRQEILAIASEDESPDVVYQLNLQLFPLSGWSDSEGGL
jgi:uncharacterized protein (TIGR02147 family)